MTGYERCPDRDGGWLCDQRVGHDGPHRAALPGRNRAWRWGLAEVGCADTACMKGADHDGGHNDRKGTTWWPEEAGTHQKGSYGSLDD